MTEPRTEDTPSTKSQAQAPVPLPSPAQVPFYDENYTFADRERDLVLIENLLSKELHNVRMELSLVRHQVLSGEFAATTASR